MSTKYTATLTNTIGIELISKTYSRFGNALLPLVVLVYRFILLRICVVQKQLWWICHCIVTLDIQSCARFPSSHHTAVEPNVHHDASRCTDFTATPATLNMRFTTVTT